MAQSYYKYVERKAEDRINWAEVGKNMSDMLTDERDRRETQKAAIDAGSAQFGLTLDNAPESQYEGFADWTLTYTDNIRQAMLMQDKLLKSGKLSVRDYTLQRQNLTAGTKNVFEIMKTWNADYEEARKVLDEGQLSEMSASMLMELEHMGNFNSHSLYINPTDFRISLGKRKLKDPNKEYDALNNPYTFELSENPEDFESVSALKNRMKQLVLKYDVETEVASSVDLFADIYQEVRRANDLIPNKVTTIDDLRRNPEYSNAVTNLINSQLENPVSAASILADNDAGGIDWDFTRNPDLMSQYKEGEDGELECIANCENQHLILMEANPNQPDGGPLVPKLTEFQREKAADWLNTQIEVMVQKKETHKKEFAPQQKRPPTIAAEKIDTIKSIHQTQVKNTNAILGGNEEEFEAATQDIENDYDGNLGTIVDIDRGADGSGLIIQFELEGALTDKKIDYKTEDGTPKTSEAITRELFNLLYPKTTFDKALEDYNEKHTLTNPDDYDLSKQKRTRAIAKKPPVKIFIDEPYSEDYSYEQHFMDNIKGSYETASSYVEDALMRLIPNENPVLYTPTEEEAKKLLKDNNLKDWKFDIYKGSIDAKGATNLVVFKIGGKKYAIPYDDDSKRLWRDLLEIMNADHGGELD